MAFVVVVSKDDAAQAFRELYTVLTTGDAKSSLRDVHWPSGHSTFRVYWHAKHGFWVVPRDHPKKRFNRFWCAFGTENLRRRRVGITCEVNPPKYGRNLRCAGVFLRDSKGALYLAHTGRVGGGKKGVGQKAFLNFYRRPSEIVKWPDRKSASLLVIGKVSSPTFLPKLAEFIFAVERFKEKATISGNVDNQLSREAVKALKQGAFDPKNVKESHDSTLREITIRRGQPEFRKNLLNAYGKRCAICSCDCVDVLEAAHIKPYGGEDTNHVQNGLLLRSDLHTLFDLGKIAIHPLTRKVIVAKPLLATVYGKLNGKKLRAPAHPEQLPNADVLREHLDRANLK